MPAIYRVSMIVERAPSAAFPAADEWVRINDREMMHTGREDEAATFVRLVGDLAEHPAKISNLREAVEFYDKAHADPEGDAVGATRDAIDWLVQAARAVVTDS